MVQPREVGSCGWGRTQASCACRSNARPAAGAPFSASLGAPLGEGRIQFRIGGGKRKVQALPFRQSLHSFARKRSCRIQSCRRKSEVPTYPFQVRNPAANVRFSMMCGAKGPVSHTRAAGPPPQHYWWPLSRRHHLPQRLGRYE
jgi:hypothetical protein